jgi:hypothetical protein
MSLMAVSSAAVAQSAPQPSREKVRGDSEISSTTLFVTLFAVAAIVGGTAVALTSDDKPASP